LRSEGQRISLGLLNLLDACAALGLQYSETCFLFVRSSLLRFVSLGAVPDLAEVGLKGARIKLKERVAFLTN